MNRSFSVPDQQFMLLALQLAEKGNFSVEPNPRVGAVVVKSNKIIATGYHQSCGSDHAERDALKKVNTPNCTLYVNLEPCAHFGRTPPCTEIIIQKKIRRVVCAMTDPNPLVNGKGIETLRRAKIKVETGLLEERARQINRHYLTYISQNRPYIALHAGISLDGKLSDLQKNSCWINSSLSRRISHSLRTEFSAILVGINTILNDNPRLTIREKGLPPKRFYRVILDRHNRLSHNLKIFSDQEQSPLIIFSSQKTSNQQKKSPLHFFIPETEEGLELNEVLKKLKELEIASLLVEGGAKVLNSFIRNKLYDEIVLFYSNRFLGGRDSLQPFESGFPLNATLLAKKFQLISLEKDFIWRGWF